MVDWSIRLPEHVVVTGSANGLGDECARLLTNAQCRVYGVDVATPPDGLALCGHYVHVVGSVTDPSTWDEVEKHLDLAENIATIGFIGAAAILDVAVLEEEELDSWRRTWEVNVGATCLLSNDYCLASVPPTTARLWSSAVSMRSSPSNNWPPTPLPKAH